MAGGKIISGAVKSAARSAAWAALRVGKLTVQKARQMAKEKLKGIIAKFKLKIREFAENPVKTTNQGLGKLNDGAKEHLQPPPRPVHRPSGTSMHPTNAQAWETGKMDRELGYYGVPVSMGGYGSQKYAQHEEQEWKPHIVDDVSQMDPSKTYKKKTYDDGSVAWREVDPTHQQDVVFKSTDRDPNKQYEMIRGTEWGKEWAWRVIKPRHPPNVVLKREDRDPRKEYVQIDGMKYGVQFAWREKERPAPAGGFPGGG